MGIWNHGNKCVIGWVRGAKALRALKNVWKERLLYGRAEIGMFEGVVSKMLYGCEAWPVDQNVYWRVDVLET